LEPGNAPEVTMAALKVMRIVARKYEYRDGDDLVELDAIVAAVFPKLAAVFQAGLADVQTNVVLLRLCCKIYYSTTYMDLPKSLDWRPWMEGMFVLAGANHGPIRRGT